ncbi:MAG: biopolymer transporter ExbD [Sterolibacterium sp.]|nr:biopolymer transporter ExbD [Sterolibacterium sp.]
MNFQRNRVHEEPEINLIPMIDILLVILIFLMVTTTYSKYTGLEINLPTADAEQKAEQSNEINVVVNHQGEVMVNRLVVAGRDVEAISLALRRVAEANATQAPVVIISADAQATHQSVIDVMQAAQQAGLAHISFATQNANH